MVVTGKAAGVGLGFELQIAFGTQAHGGASNDLTAFDVDARLVPGTFGNQLERAACGHRRGRHCGGALGAGGVALACADRQTDCDATGMRRVRSDGGGGVGECQRSRRDSHCLRPAVFGLACGAVEFVCGL